MISAWWLLLIIPAAFSAGLVLGGILSINKGLEEYDAYMFHQYLQEREEKEKSD